MSAYAKVIVGNEEEEEFIPIATGRLLCNRVGSDSADLNDDDIEAPSAIPIVSDEYYRRPPPIATTAHPGVYSYQNGNGNRRITNTNREEDEDLDCAKISCYLSFIPIVGFISCFYNADALTDSKRETYTFRACAISTFVTMINLIFWFSWESSDDDNCPPFQKPCR